MCLKPFTLSLMKIKRQQGKCCDNLIHLITKHEVNDRRDALIESLSVPLLKAHESSDHQSILLQLQSA